MYRPYRRPQKPKIRNFEKPEKQGLKVVVRNGDLDQALRVFKNKVKRSGLIQEIRKKRYYTKPSEERRLAKRRGIKRWQKYLKKRDINNW